MKAKDMAKQYEESGYTKECLTKIMMELREEIFTLMDKRGIVQDSPNLRGAVAVFDELNQKFNAFARRVNEAKGEPHLKDDGFYMLLRAIAPELCDSVEEMKQIVRDKEARMRQR